MAELEKDIENKFRDWCRGRGHLCPKMRPLSNAVGFPDRMVIMNNGMVIFIEFKRQNGRLSVPQEKWIDRLKRRKQKASVCWSLEQAKRIIEIYERYETMP